MLPFQQAHFDAVIAHNFEGDSPWPYLDTHTPPLITDGVGCATGLAEMQTLPYTVNGQPATAGQIQQAYARVMAMPGGEWYTHYRYDGCLMLTNDGILQLVEKRYSVYTPQLIGLFPQFMSWPVQAQTAMLDLIWGCGLGIPARNGGHATGIHEFVHVITAALQTPPDFTTCADNCAEDANVTAYTLRNAWRRSLFLAAATATTAAAT